MQIIPSHQALQDFVLAVSCGKFDDISMATVDDQAQVLDHLVMLLQYCERFGANTPQGLHISPEFFAIPYIERFFTDLFPSLDESLYTKAEVVFLRGLAFTLEYIGPPKSRDVVYLLLNRLQKRFPALKEMYDNAIANFMKEFFRPTIGNFIKQHKNTVDHLEMKYPLFYTLFIAPLKTPKFADRQLYNFYCNPWIYQRLVNYLAYHAHLPFSEVAGQRLEKSMEWFEERLQIICSRTSEESWQELVCKARETLNHSKNLESFAIEAAGLMGEIKTAAQFLKNQCQPEDTLTFLPKLKDRPNCDLIVMRHKTGDGELIESKAKTPRHGLDENIAGDVQIWDDFFTNFSDAICSYLTYLQETVHPPLGLTKLFPLFSTFEGSDYGYALPILGNIPANTLNPLKEWSSEQKLIHLLRALFLRPLVLNTPFTLLSSDTERLIQREQATRDVFKKEWVTNVIQKAIEQLKKTQQDQMSKGIRISKMYVALDLELSHRLTHDPYSYDDGNILEIAEQALREIFEPYKSAFAENNVLLELLIIKF